MKVRRLTLLGMMGTIAAIAVAFAAFRAESLLVASLAWTGAITVLTVAALVAVFDPRRTFCVGFAVVGLIYAGFSALQSDPEVSPLVSQRAIGFLFVWAHDGLSTALFVFSHAGASGDFGRDWFDEHDIPIWRVMWVGQAIFTMVHACVGGLVAGWLRPRLLRDREAKAAS